mmetsp:Transcript_23355/g.41485  ORF Transcript_23355/g.41485 Transcript_23355/m.41485 type:complete len:230 (-) Transcript_23355:627-1316(-)
MPATTPPSTPLQVREYQRKAQRCVRLAANSVNRGRDCWEDAAKNGREHITDFTNALLEERSFASAELGALADIPRLTDAVQRKLTMRRRASLLMAAQEMEQLISSADCLRSACQSAHELIDAPETAQPMVAGVPVFHSLSLSTLGSLLDEMAAMHEAEVTVKQQILEALREAEGEYLTQKRKGSTKKVNLDLLRTTLNVYIASWMLEPELDESRLAEIMGIIQEEMKGF